MNILINCSNLNGGGGLQVADSVCCQLNNFPQHNFTVVLSQYLYDTGKKVQSYGNCEVVSHDFKFSLTQSLWGRYKYLDDLVQDKIIDCVLTIFGPSYWRPQCIHICGFARPQIVLTQSPYYEMLSWHTFLLQLFKNKVHSVAFRRDSDYLFTENPYISELLKHMWPNKTVTTITNNYHQIYDNQGEWHTMKLPNFNGCTLLCISVNYRHKNLSIALDIARILKTNYPNFKFRFVFTVSPTEFSVPDELKHFFCLIGNVNIQTCPSLYKQADIMFQPTLLECFSATYPEAMKMGVPIITTDIEFAHGLCNDAAVYYSPLSARDAAEAIIRLANDEELKKKLIMAGYSQLSKFDTTEQRVNKLIHLCEFALTD
jgi:glycosyltransferase involved in cell wall biosynthesis